MTLSRTYNSTLKNLNSTLKNIKIGFAYDREENCSRKRDFLLFGTNMAGGFNVATYMLGWHSDLLNLVQNLSFEHVNPVGLFISGVSVAGLSACISGIKGICSDGKRLSSLPRAYNDKGDILPMTIASPHDPTSATDDTWFSFDDIIMSTSTFEIKHPHLFRQPTKMPRNAKGDGGKNMNALPKLSI